MSEVADVPAGETNAPTVFFSYSRSDRERALPIIRAIEAAGFNVWWDGLLEGGSVYLTETERALEGASAVVVLWSAQSITSHWVQDEAMSGRAKSRLVPLTIDGATPPLGFRQYQVIDVDAWTGDPHAPEIEQMMHAIGVLHGEAPTPSMRAKSLPYQNLNRRHLMLGGAALAGIATVAALFARPGQGDGAKLVDNGVAILPIRNSNDRADLNYLASGLTSEIRAALARNPALKVVGDISSEAVSAENLDAKTMATRLGVAHLMEGRLTIEGDNATLFAALNAGETGFQIWSEQYTYSLNELAQLKDLIAAKIIGELTEQVSGQSETPIGPAPKAAAYNAYLKGLELYRLARDTESDLKALAYFETAIEADPAFAEAEAGRAKVLTVLGNTSDDVKAAAQFYASAAEAAQHAVALGPDLADTHSTLGFVLFQAQLKVKDARAPFDRSAELGKGDGAVMARFAGYCAALKRDDDAERAISRALTLDPLNPTLHRASGYVQYAQRHFEKSIEHVRQALLLNPRMSDAHARIGMALVFLDRAEEALEHCAKEASRMQRFTCEAIALHRLKRIDESNASLAALTEAFGDSALYQQAQVLAQTEKLDAAMQALTQSHRFGDSGLTYLNIDPALDPLRKRAEFLSLSNALGFDMV